MNEMFNQDEQEIDDINYNMNPGDIRITVGVDDRTWTFDVNPQMQFDELEKLILQCIFNAGQQGHYDKPTYSVGGVQIKSGETRKLSDLNINQNCQIRVTLHVRSIRSFKMEDMFDQYEQEVVDQLINPGDIRITVGVADRTWTFDVNPQMQFDKLEPLILLLIYHAGQQGHYDKPTYTVGGVQIKSGETRKLSDLNITQNCQIRVALPVKSSSYQVQK